ncbi:HIRAN domain-containing protein [Bacillus proteolyticus]|uniref:HIRAN domain-containing protein n=1 Tax=Bacillus proteolyticus TaxID=2026192 RepID=UPI002E1AE0B0|nr:HIRAN domain-containing protein [Bacillus proteolyticus]
MEYPIIDVNSWEIVEEMGPGAGDREKEWIKQVETDRIAMFKVPREDRGEHWAEKLCSEIAQVIEFPCAKVDLAIRNDKVGCLSHFFVNSEEGYSHYDGGKFFPYDYDDETNKGYNIQLIYQVLSAENLFEDFLFIVVFDALVGNGDRHQDNWGITRHDKKTETFISPLYDNSACLGRELSIVRVKEYLDSESEFLRYVFRSASKMGWEETKKEKHFALIKRLYVLFPEQIAALINRLELLTDERIDEIVDALPLSVISLEHKLLVTKYIKKRRDILIRIGDNMDNVINKLLLIWKDPETRRRHIVGQLSFDSDKNIYKFQYMQPGLDEAKERGFIDYPNFPDLNKVYEMKDKLFKSIKSRLPQPKRPDYPIILDRYGLDTTCTDLELLEATRGRVATDNFEFVKDISEDSGDSLHLTFDLAAARHYKFPQIAKDLQIGDSIKLELEPENEYDRYAVRVLSQEDVKIGYVPKYYSYNVHCTLKEHKKYSAYIVSLDIDNKNADEWAKIKLKIEFENE